MFIVELMTRDGKVCESYPTYAEARRRIELYPAEALTGLPLLFEELPDGSQRLVREDGKPLQWHRLPEEEDRSLGRDEVVSLVETPINLGRPIFHTRAADDEDDGPPLPLVDG